MLVDEIGTRFGELPHGRHVAGFDRREECRKVHPLDVILECSPARKAVGPGEDALRVGQHESGGMRVLFEARDFGDGSLFGGAVGTEQFLGLLFELGQARPGGESARGRRLRRHAVLLSAAGCRMARCPRREPKEGTLAINSNAPVRWAQPFPRTQQRPERWGLYYPGRRACDSSAVEGVEESKRSSRASLGWPGRPEGPKGGRVPKG